MTVRAELITKVSTDKIFYNVSNRKCFILRWNVLKMIFNNLWDHQVANFSYFAIWWSKFYLSASATCEFYCYFRIILAYYKTTSMEKPSNALHSATAYQNTCSTWFLRTSLLKTPLGEKVSMLTHMYPHKAWRKIEVIICKITRLTAHFMCGLMSDLLICTCL